MYSLMEDMRNLEKTSSPLDKAVMRETNSLFFPTANAFKDSGVHNWLVLLDPKCLTHAFPLAAAAILERFFRI